MSSTAFTGRRACLVAAGAAATLALGFVAIPASATPSQPTPSGFVVHTYPAVGTEKSPDDITRLGDSIYVTFQNGVGPLGEPSPSGATASTIQQYSLKGVPGKSWSVTGKVDGLTADPHNHRLLLTANEDGNSSFLTLDPSSTAAPKRYTYEGLTHGGGTDAIAIAHGTIIVSASNPSDPTGPAAYSVHLSGTTAKLAPVLSDNAVGTSINTATAGQTVQLALTDPDSNLAVPRSVARFGGSLLLDGQADKQLVFVNRAEQKKPSLSVLSVAQPLDDTVFATRSRGTLWVTDPTHNTVDSVTGPFTAGEAISSATPDSGSAYLAALDLQTGDLPPIAGLTSIVPKGLLFTGASGNESGDDSNEGPGHGTDHGSDGGGDSQK